MPRPVLKWVGGKRHLIPQLEPYLPTPEECRGYVDPFVGGGALFCYRYHAVRPAWLADTNPELVALYRALRDDVDGVVEATLHLEERYHAQPTTDDCAAMFYDVAAMNPERLVAIGRAARLIFLNRTCFNGLYRTDRRGRFNVSWGKNPSARILFEDELREASAALYGVEIRYASFEDTLRDAPIGPGVLVYLDPPYVPASKTASFDSYGAGRFTWQQQGQLLTLAEQAVDRGAIVVASNAFVPEIVDLYRRSRAGFHVAEIQAKRAVAARACSREPVGEMVATTWRGE